MKPHFKIVYPVKLGMERENELLGPSKRKKTTMTTDTTKVENLINDINISNGRWINTNYEDWSNPKWEKIDNVCGVVVDRALGGNKFSEAKRDLAIYTEYEDPNSQMIVFDLVPIESPIFDMNKEPSKDLNEVYQFSKGSLKKGISYPMWMEFPLSPIQGVLYHYFGYRGFPSPHKPYVSTHLLEYEREFPATLMMLGTMFATVAVASLSVMGEDK